MKDESNNPSTMSFLSHLAELRRRLIFIALSILIGSILGYLLSAEVFSLLSLPFRRAFSEELLIGTGPAEAFILKIKMSIFVGAVLSSPLVFFQIWRFTAPALNRNEQCLLLPFILAGTALFLTGILFCYLVVLPFAFDFFRDQYLSIQVTPTIRISEQLALTLRALLGFALVFELPVATFFLARLGVIDHHFLIRWSRHAIVAIFILSAFLTPPDVLTQFLMAVPLILLYGISIILAKFGYRPRK